MSPFELVGMLLSVMLAAATQRITGLGFALVSAPLLVLTAGPHSGVLLANLLSLLTNLLVLGQTWRDVDVRRVTMLAVPALCFVPIGQFVARHVPTPTLLIGIGGLVLAALAAVRLLRRSTLFAGRGGAVAAGAMSGFMNVTAGVGGPAMTLYAVGSRWPHQSFVGSMQLYFAVLNVGSILVKGLPDVGAPILAGAICALGFGLAIGHVLAPRISHALARSVVLGLAVAGAAATVVKGAFLILPAT